MRRDTGAGLAFLNVLVTVALGAGLVAAMISRQDSAIEDAARRLAFLDAQLIADGALLEVQLALEADGRSAPEADHFGERWYQSAQSQIAIADGSILVELSDLSGLIDVNALAGPADVAVLARAFEQIDLPPGLAASIADTVRRNGTIQSLDALKEWMPDLQTELLQKVAYAAPYPHPVNLNTAPTPVLAALFPQRGAVRGLLAARDTNAELTAADLTRLGLLRPRNTGWTTRTVKARVRVQQNGVAVLRETVFQRSQDAPDQIGRRFQQFYGDKNE